MTSDDHEIEQRLRDATRAYADRVEPAGDAWERVSTRIERSRRHRRARWVGGTAVVTAAAAAVALALWAGRDGGNVRVDVPPAGPPTTAPSTSTPTTGPTEPSPFFAPAGVTYAQPGRIVGPDRKVLTPLDGSAVVHRLEYSPDGARLWGLVAATAEDPCGLLSDHVWTADPDAAPVFASRRASGFALSPDGTKVAYATRGTDCEESPRPLTHVVIRDLASGDEQVWSHEPGLDDDLPLFVDRMAWSPDGAQLAIERCYETCDVAIIDPARSGRFVDAPSLALGRDPAWLADGRIAVVRNDASAATILAVDPTTRAETQIATSNVPVSGLWSTTGGLLIVFEDGTFAVKGGPSEGSIDVDVTAAAYWGGSTGWEPADLRSGGFEALPSTIPGDASAVSGALVAAVRAAPGDGDRPRRVSARIVGASDGPSLTVVVQVRGLPDDAQDGIDTHVVLARADGGYTIVRGWTRAVCRRGVTADHAMCV